MRCLLSAASEPHRSTGLFTNVTIANRTYAAPVQAVPVSLIKHNNEIRKTSPEWANKIVADHTRVWMK